MNVYNANTKLFNNSELLEIDKLWDEGNIVEKHQYSDRYYKNSIVNNSSSKKVISKLVKWFNSLDIDEIVNEPTDLILHRFSEGSFFNRHTDNQVRNGNLRKYLVGISLNDNYAGGKFITFNPNKLRVGKYPGVPYVLDSRVEHKVTEVKEGIRKSAFIFIFDKHLKKSILL